MSKAINDRFRFTHDYDTDFHIIKAIEEGIKVHEKLTTNVTIKITDIFERELDFCEMLLMLYEKVRYLDSLENDQKSVPFYRRTLNNKNWYIKYLGFTVSPFFLEKREKQKINWHCKELTPRNDDRVEISELENCLRLLFNEDLPKLSTFNKIKRNHDATVLIVHKDWLIDEGDGNLLLPGKKLRTSNLLGEKIHQEMNLSYYHRYSSSYAYHTLGSGIVVNNNKIITSGHLLAPDINNEEWNNLRIISGFTSSIFNSRNRHRILKEIVFDYSKGLPIPKENIFKVKPDTLSLKFAKDYIDYATFEIDLSASDSPIKSIDFDKNTILNLKPIGPSNTCIDLNTPVYCCGHGLGQYKKLHYDGWITKFPDDEYLFKCSLDLYGGNSGSPIFDSNSHELIGILSSGLPRFKNGKRFIKFVHYPLRPGLGETCQRIDKINFKSLI